MTQYVVRRATLEDIHILPTIEQAASALFSSTPYAAAVSHGNLSVEFHEECSKEGRLWVAAAAPADNPIGFAAVLMIDGEPHLQEVSIHPDHGRKGLGTRLVRSVIEWTGDRGYSSLTLLTFRDVAWNMPWYVDRFGFEEISADAYGPELRNLVEAETRAGLPPEKRAALRLTL